MSESLNRCPKCGVDMGSPKLAEYCSSECSGRTESPSTLIRKIFDEWYEKTYDLKPATTKGVSYAAWEAAWIASNEFTLKIMNAGASSEIRLNESDMRETFRKMEAWIERYESNACNMAQIINVLMQEWKEANCWSEWDESVRAENVQLQRDIAELAPYLKHPLLETSPMREMVAFNRELEALKKLECYILQVCQCDVNSYRPVDFDAQYMLKIIRGEA